MTIETYRNVKRILIRAVNWIGDAVMTTPALCAIRKNFPDAEITLLANPAVSELFTHHPTVDKVVTFERSSRHSGIIGRFRLAGELKLHKYDLAVILPNSFDSAFVPWLSGIPMRFGRKSDGRGFMLTECYLPDKKIKQSHEVEYYLDLVRSFGISGDISAAPLLVTTAEEDAGVAAYLKEFGVNDSDFLLGINPGAAFGSAKRWYPERFAEVAERLAREWNASIIIFGGKDEISIADGMQSALTTTCINMAGRTSIRQLMAHLKRCNFLVTNDSGPMHIAAAFGVPLAAIFGPTDHTGTAPYTDNYAIVRKETECAPCKLRKCPTDHHCMTAITSGDVADAAIKLKGMVQKII